MLNSDKEKLAYPYSLSFSYKHIVRYLSRISLSTSEFLQGNCDNPAACQSQRWGSLSVSLMSIPLSVSWRLKAALPEVIAINAL